MLSWNAAAERLFGWPASDLLGRRAPIVPDELMAEHNAVLERVRAGGRVSLTTKRFHQDGRLLDLRVDTSALCSPAGVLLGYVSVYHAAEDDDAAHGRMVQRARLVRRLTDVVGDINAELDLPVVLDRIAASLTELTGADAGGFVSIEGSGCAWSASTSCPKRCVGRPPGCTPAWSPNCCAPARPCCSRPARRVSRT
ncbi:hypothetical protein GCM10027612_09760 [Microbispora bryophytorum subsp. camponoti]